MNPINSQNSSALLQELLTLQQRLLKQGESAAIDLHTLPLSPSDRDRLRNFLGHGEVAITLNALGHSEIYETAFAGIWWTTHYSESGTLIAEQLEVTLLPAMVSSDIAEVAASHTLFSQQMNDEYPPLARSLDAHEGVNHVQ
ncbi:MAG: hydrogenase expression/formation protein [Gammaproteobacteria bacterium]|nr:hydrogenase expression/formation protein [Gammaproteobacteria bacterium]